jgi:outer membrane immunogenic protein
MGVHAGYGWRDSTFNLVDTSSEFFPTGLTFLNPKSSGILGGIQGGANQQFGSWVFGIEADMSMIDGSSVASGPFGDPAFPDARVIAHSEIDWLATFTSRLGYAVDRSLFYIKGGVAAGAFSERYTFDDPTGI